MSLYIPEDRPIHNHIRGNFKKAIQKDSMYEDLE